jgi:hypothetical protein
MLLAPLSLAVAGAVSAPALAGQTDVTIEVGASQIGPPVGLDAESARFAVAGLRASRFGLSGAGVYGSVLGGRTLGNANGGDFVTAIAGGTLAEWWTPAIRGSLDLRVLAFAVGAPFTYTAVAVEGGPSVTLGSGPISLKLGAVAGAGGSSFEVRRLLGGTRVVEDDLGRIGGIAELTLGSGAVRFGTTGGHHGTPGGSFTSGGARLLLAGVWGAVEARADVWRTPMGTETTAALAFGLALSGWSVRGFFGRSEPDPLTLAQPGSTSGGVLLGRELYSRRAGAPAGRQPWELVAVTPAGATIVMTVDAPDHARAVALLADFTLWDAVPMQRRGGRWEVRIEVPAGTHHYGFLIDDEWYVPGDTRDVVPDEWGRVSAILVIEGVD